MSDWSPPSLPRNWLIGLGALYGLFALYSLLVVQQVLLGVIVPALLFASLYITWRFLAAVEAIADALQRIADQREEGERITHEN